jgi:hypothetical protein
VGEAQLERDPARELPQEEAWLRPSDFHLPAMSCWCLIEMNPHPGAMRDAAWRMARVSRLVLKLVELESESEYFVLLALDYLLGQLAGC